MLLLLAAVATIVVAFIMIYSRKKRQAQSTTEKQQFDTERRRLEEELRAAEEHRKAEEERNRLEEEARRGVAGVQEKVEEEASPKAPQLHQSEAESPGSAEQRKSPDEETRHNWEEEGFNAQEEENKWVEPGKRGGRPRGSTRERERQQAQETKSLRPKPEIVCWKRGREWILGVEVPEELLESSGLVVLQNTSPVTQDETEEGSWRLNEASGHVEINWKQGEENEKIEIALGQNRYLLFKLSGRNRGRCVKNPSFGSYLVVVPESLERDETLSGLPSANPEPTSISGYCGHYFDLERGSGNRIAFHTADDTSLLVNPNMPRFELVGSRLNDASEEMGPLFAEKPPQVRTLDEQAWKDVETIVVGEEGSGTGRWRTTFSPISGPIEQDLPSELTVRKGSWYFLRLYDRAGDLIESLDFRFVRGLNGINVHQPSPVPLQVGHTAACVELFHEPDCRIQPATGAECSVLIEHERDKTILTIPPDPNSDKTCWLVGPEDRPQVEVTILVERIWWVLGQEDAQPSEWADRSIALQRDQFAATSKRTLWLRLPRQRWAREVVVGFEQQRARRYKPKVTEKTVAIQLRDFCDAEELRALGRSGLKVWISSQGTMRTGVLCELLVKLACKFCDFSTTDKRDIFSHIGSEHITEFIQSLTYDDMRSRIPSLPPGIYKCPYCGFYVTSDDPKNPTSAISNHEQERCIGARQEAHLKGGSVQIRIHSISDVDEIRENVISHLPRIYKCNLCGSELHDPTENDQIRHLTKHHENVLYDVC